MSKQRLWEHMNTPLTSIDSPLGYKLAIFHYSWGDSNRVHSGSIRRDDSQEVIGRLFSGVLHRADGLKDVKNGGTRPSAPTLSPKDISVLCKDTKFVEEVLDVLIPSAWSGQKYPQKNDKESSVDYLFRLLEHEQSEIQKWGKDLEQRMGNLNQRVQRLNQRVEDLRPRVEGLSGSVEHEKNKKIFEETLSSLKASGSLHLLNSDEIPAKTPDINTVIQKEEQELQQGEQVVELLRLIVDEGNKANKTAGDSIKIAGSVRFMTIVMTIFTAVSIVIAVINTCVSCSSTSKAIQQTQTQGIVVLNGKNTAVAESGESSNETMAFLNIKAELDLSRFQKVILDEQTKWFKLHTSQHVASQEMIDSIIKDINQLKKEMRKLQIQDTPKPIRGKDDSLTTQPGVNDEPN